MSLCSLRVRQFPWTLKWAGGRNQDFMLSGEKLNHTELYQSNNWCRQGMIIMVWGWELFSDSWVIATKRKSHWHEAEKRQKWICCHLCIFKWNRQFRNWMVVHSWQSVPRKIIKEKRKGRGKWGTEKARKITRSPQWKYRRTYVEDVWPHKR